MLKYFDNVQCSYFSQYMLEKTERTIKNNQHRDTGNIVYKTQQHITEK